MAGIFYPQVAVTLRILWEDFKLSSEAAKATDYELSIMAKTVRVHVNDYSHADTFTVEVDYKSFPFDPRLIRSCGITVHMENMGKLYDDDGEIVKIKPRSDKKDNDGKVIHEGNTIFQGFADDESIAFDDDKRTVTLEGRDFTSLFLDRKFPISIVNLQGTVDEVIQFVVDKLPENVVINSKGTKAITIENRVLDEDGNKVTLPTLASFWSDPHEKSGQKNVHAEESYWEVIQDIVSRAGLIAFIELDKLVITKPRVLYSKKSTVYMVYGKNVRHLEFKRKIGRRKNFNLVLRSMNFQTKSVETVYIPKDATAEWSNAVGVPNKEVKVEKIGPNGLPIKDDNAQAAPYIAFSIPDVASKEQLIVIGQETYEEIGRQEIEGSLETRDMEAWHFNAKDKRVTEGCFDLLKLRIGAPISIEIDHSDMQAISRMNTVPERKRYLLSMGYPSSAAETIAVNLGRVATPFYTKAVEYSYEREQGFTCKIEFINFIEQSNKGFSKS